MIPVCFNLRHIYDAFIESGVIITESLKRQTTCFPYKLIENDLILLTFRYTSSNYTLSTYSRNSFICFPVSTIDDLQ